MGRHCEELESAIASRHVPELMRKCRRLSGLHAAGQPVRHQPRGIRSDSERDPTKPFSLCCHHNAPHDHWEYHPRHEHIFDDVQMPEPDSLWEDKAHRSEGSRGFGSTILDLADKRMTRNWRPTGTLDTEGIRRKWEWLRPRLT